MICPTCSGSQLAGHPAGWLAWQHTTVCDIGDAEDATRAADHERTYSRHTVRLPDGTFTRPTTDAERTLLNALGHTTPDTLATTVQRITHSVIARTWPTLEPKSATT